MSSPSEEFFDELGRSRHDPRLEKATGTLRFDLAHGEQTDQWLVTIDKGDVAVSRAKRKADCVARADRRLFDGLVTGKENALASVLRGDIDAEGDLELLVLFQRLFPGPQA